MFSLNLRSVFVTCKAAMAHLPAGGSIVNVASIAGFTASPGLAAYGAAKAGVIALTRTLAVEAAPTGSGSTAWPPAGSGPSSPGGCGRTPRPAGPWSPRSRWAAGRTSRSWPAAAAAWPPTPAATSPARTLVVDGGLLA